MYGVENNVVIEKIWVGYCMIPINEKVCAVCCLLKPACIFAYYVCRHLLVRRCRGKHPQQPSNRLCVCCGCRLRMFFWCYLLDFLLGFKKAIIILIIKFWENKHVKNPKRLYMSLLESLQDRPLSYFRVQSKILLPVLPVPCAGATVSC